MIDIKKLQLYYENDMVFVTAHAAERFRQRGIKNKDIRYAVQNGEIIEQYPEDYPYPSCLLLGFTVNSRPLHVVLCQDLKQIKMRIFHRKINICSLSCIYTII